MADHTEVVRAVKADLVARGFDLSGPCGAFAITSRVAYRLRDEGAGVLDKPVGNNCNGFSVDAICYPSGALIDCLADAGGANDPQWLDAGAVDPARYHEVTTDPDATLPPPPDPTPTPTPPAPCDLTPVIEQLDRVIAMLNETNAALAVLLTRPVPTPPPAYVTSVGGAKFTSRPVL
jgi:hypothetical protein